MSETCELNDDGNQLTQFLWILFWKMCTLIFSLFENENIVDKKKLSIRLHAPQKDSTGVIHSNDYIETETFAKTVFTFSLYYVCVFLHFSQSQ